LVLVTPPDHKHKDVSSSIEQKLILNLVKVAKLTDPVTFESKEVDKILQLLLL
jgi:hypothetical protein